MSTNMMMLRSTTTNSLRSVGSNSPNMAAPPPMPAHHGSSTTHHPLYSAPSSFYNQHPSSLSHPSGVNKSVFHDGPVSGDLNASVSTDGAALTSPGSITNVFEGEIPVYTKQLNREEVCQPLGICVSLGRGGNSGVSKCINIRVTDPKDPFFLFSVSLLEDDYGRFKEKQELNVDFNGFPRDLVAMINSVANSSGNNCVVFVVDSPQTAVLRILEKTEFRSLEHLSIALTRQGDVGQKLYLAEKFGYFHSAFNKSEALRHEEGARAEGTIAELREALSVARSTISELSEKLKLESSNSSASHMSTVAQLKDRHAAEVRSIQQAADEERQQLVRKLDSLQSQFSTERNMRDEEISRLRAQLQATESNKSTLETQLRIAEDTLSNTKLELENVRKHNSELQEFRAQATKRMSESELSSVSVTERLRYLTETLNNRESELRLARDQRAQQDDHANTLAEQLKSLQEKLKNTEASLAKAHHILGSQVQAIKGAKDKYSSLKAHLESNETLLADRNNLIDRLRNDVAGLTEKVEHFQGKVTGLKDQLMKAEEQNTKLASQLKQNEDALIHLQRMSSGYGTRVHTAAASPQLTSFNGGNLYRQFAAGSSANYTGTGSTFQMASANASTALPSATATSNNNNNNNGVGRDDAPSSQYSPPASMSTPLAQPSTPAPSTLSTGGPTFSSVHANNALTQHNSLSAGIHAAASSSYGAHLSNSNVGAVSYLPQKQRPAAPTEKPSAYFS